MLTTGCTYKIQEICNYSSEKLSVMSYYGLMIGSVFKVLSLYQKKGLAVINVHEQTFLVRLTDLSCFSCVHHD